ncbi:nucleoporin [Halococcus sp. IIIV-5B]|uniref:nucleoporin FG repeat-containing protein n=1 Tax=Halococcus sp. IIIV-5B TaxID=2321230 RepID=UPI000E7278E5|nr:nucleoporin [Halococcus sp. IIIV-5B]RJT04913.1 nucleoporin [Halococcus sp. IIIV-5B]
MSTLTKAVPRNRGRKLALVVGYLALAGGVLFAYDAPTTGYEVSIYGATPWGFWLGVGIALVVGVVVTLYVSEGYVNLAGLFLAGGSVVSVAALPLIRSYYYYGSADGMTHLGWTKDLYNGSMSIFGDFYPGVHTVGLFVSGVLGMPITRALLIAVLLFVVAYIVFIPLCIRSMTSHRGAMVLGGLTGLLLLPINHFGTNYMTPHPISDTILLTPIVIYLLINYVTSPTDIFETRFPVSAAGGAFGLILGALVLYHPQQASNLVVLFITISGVQFIYRTFRPNSRIAEHKPLYAPTLFLIGCSMVWGIGRSRLNNALDAVTRELSSFLTGGGSDLGAGTASQGSSLVAAGGSIPELFLKLFGVSIVFAALAGLLMLTSIFGRLRDAPDTSALVKYFTIGLVVLIPYSLAFYVGSVSELFFRNVGLIMLISTILGTIALYRYITGLSEILPGGAVRATTVVVIVIMLVLSIAVVFPSPYLFIPNDQVTEGRMDGYDYTFSHTGPNASVYGVREGPWRVSHGLYGVEANDAANDIRYSDSTVNITNATTVTTPTSEIRYLAVTGSAREREVEVYNGIRYNETAFERLEGTPGVSLVMSNGELDLYRIANNTTSPAVNNATVSTNTTAGPATGANGTTSNATNATNGSVFGNAPATVAPSTSPAVRLVGSGTDPGGFPAGRGS